MQAPLLVVDDTPWPWVQDAPPDLVERLLATGLRREWISGLLLPQSGPWEILATPGHEHHVLQWAATWPTPCFTVNIQESCE